MNRILLILIILFITISNFFPFIFIENRESTIFEILQAFLIMIAIIVHLKTRKFYLLLSNNLIFILKFLFLSILFYEEISFLTYGNKSFLTDINSQSEINLHNLSFLGDTIFKINLPFINYSASIETYFFVGAIFLFILGYGSYFTFLNKFKLLFLERKYSIYTFLFTIDYVLSSLISKIINPSLTFIHFEFVELFIYFIFLLDVFDKFKIMKLKFYKNKKIF